MMQIIDPSHRLWSETLQKLCHDFYHLPEYASLEAQRIGAVPEAVWIEEENKTFFLPYLLRRCPDEFSAAFTASDIFDAVSPYGYAGILLSDAATDSSNFIKLAINQLINSFRNQNICSAFIRLHPVLNQNLSQIYSSEAYRIHSETVSIDLTLSDTEIWHQTRPEHRNKINKCKRAGFVARIVRPSLYIHDFIAIYKETMDRVSASRFFYFSELYFLDLLEALGEKLHLCIVECDRQIVCAGLFTECCGIVQYHLGGTKQEFLKRSPSTLMFDHVRHWAKERGNSVFHLGGGVGGAQDSLHHFKAGFSKQRQSLSMLRLITDPEIYHHLVELRAKSLNTSPAHLLETDFFPAYRSLDMGVRIDR